VVDFHLVLGCSFKACDRDSRFCSFPSGTISSHRLLPLVSQVCPQPFFPARRLVSTVSDAGSLAIRSARCCPLTRSVACTSAGRGIAVLCLVLAEEKLCPRRDVFSLSFLWLPAVRSWNLKLCHLLKVPFSFHRAISVLGWSHFSASSSLIWEHLFFFSLKGNPWTFVLSAGTAD